MTRKCIGSAMVIALCFAASLARGAARRDGGGERSADENAGGAQAPGGAWSDYHPVAGQDDEQPRSANTEPSAAAAAAGVDAVRNNVDHPGLYGRGWYGDHPTAWSADHLAAATVWTPATWDAVAAHCGYAAVPPATYYYGSGVIYSGGVVLVNGKPVGTAEEFSQQASDIAAEGVAAPTPATDQWLPLGVYALVRDKSQLPQMIMQLAINQEGLIRGNYTDEVTDSTLPVHGMADQKTGRAAWTVGDNVYSVMEAGLSNLTANEVPALIHKNGTTQRWLLVRLEKPNS